MTDQTMQFQAEVARLLHIVTHALYSQKEIFLRELISNASDACDKLRFEAQTDSALWAGDTELCVTLQADKEARTLTISDNGIGMNRDELINHLGTIARSGTGDFVSKLGGDAAKDVNLIGQFGVGFYSAFMVAEKVEVVSRKAGEARAWRWASDGSGQFQIGEAERAGRGTTITLHLRQGEDEYLEPERLERIVKTYSDHIALPVLLLDGEKRETLNAASALWARPKSEVTEQQYKDFYHHISHAFDDPWATLHARAEGKLDYSLLLFIPTRPPQDLFDPARKSAVQLYVRRVFITDRCDDLVPAWLRFLRGVVDSADLPLNVSREMLQDNPVLARIRQAITRRVLSELERKATATEEAEKQGYDAFWEAFGAVVKEGIYEDFENRDKILKLARFRSSTREGWISLADYIAAMKEGQTAIYTLSGDSLEAVKRSPQLEGFKAKGVEVLLLTDAVDDFWLSMVPEFEGKPFRSATRGGAELDSVKAEEKADAPKPESVEGAALGTLIALLKQSLGDKVKDVRESSRLTDSACCLVAAEGDIDMHLERLLRQHKRLDAERPRVLEINPSHPLLKRMAERASAPGAADALNDAAHLLLDQARVLEGEMPSDPAAFARRLAAAMTQSIA